MNLRFYKPTFGDVLPELLSLWPAKGKWDEDNLRKAVELSVDSIKERKATAAAVDYLQINTEIAREQLREAGSRLAAIRSVPWKYQRFFEKGRPTARSALKIRPGVMLPITINGIDTTARVNTVRRLRKGGKPHFVKMDITVDTKHVPLILERETRCTCLYCGTPAAGDDTNCRACGAPLPPC